MGAMGQSCGRAWLLCMAEGQRFAGGGEAALPPESMRRSGGGVTGEQKAAGEMGLSQEASLSLPTWRERGCGDPGSVWVGGMGWARQQAFQRYSGG